MMAAALAAGIASAADVSVSMDFASAYIFRGVTLNEGLVFQPGAKISGLPIPEEIGSVALGTWANYDLYDDHERLPQNEFSEIDYYIAYTLPIKVIDLGVTYTEYTYPNVAGTESDKEVAFSVGKAVGETGLYPTIVANYGVGGLLEQNWYIQSGLDYSLSLTDALSLSAASKVGYLVRDAGTDGFNDLTSKIGLCYALTENWSLSGSLNYVVQLDDDVLLDEDVATKTLGYDVEMFAMLGAACSF